MLRVPGQLHWHGPITRGMSPIVASSLWARLPLAVDLFLNSEIEDLPNASTIPAYHQRTSAPLSLQRARQTLEAQLPRHKLLHECFQRLHLHSLGRHDEFRALRLDRDHFRQRSGVDRKLRRSTADRPNAERLFSTNRELCAAAAPAARSQRMREMATRGT